MVTVSLYGCQGPSLAFNASACKWRCRIVSRPNSHRSMAQHTRQSIRRGRCRLQTRSMMADGELDPELKEGKRVKVKEEVVIFHAAKHKEGLQLKDREGLVKQIVKNFKGKELSANLPYRVEFVIEMPEAKEIKVVAHMDASELEILD